jgi:ZIP family zinc transporter
MSVRMRGWRATRRWPRSAGCGTLPLAGCAPVPVVTPPRPPAAAPSRRGIVVDGIPESLALGLMAAQAAAGPALLLAVLVGNLTESYGAARPIVTGGGSRASAVALLGGIGLGLGAVVVLGGTVATGLPATAVGVAQAVAAGAVVAVLSISVLPYAFREASRPVAVVATAGLALGYLLGA